ncbi:hypothetical protein D3C72_2505960 [compost metagenome]
MAALGQGGLQPGQDIRVLHGIGAGLGHIAAQLHDGDVGIRRCGKGGKLGFIETVLQPV